MSQLNFWQVPGSGGPFSDSVPASVPAGSTVVPNGNWASGLFGGPTNPTAQAVGRGPTGYSQTFSGPAWGAAQQVASAINPFAGLATSALGGLVNWSQANDFLGSKGISPMSFGGLLEGLIGDSLVGRAVNGISNAFGWGTPFEPSMDQVTDKYGMMQGPSFYSDAIKGLASDFQGLGVADPIGSALSSTMTPTDQGFQMGQIGFDPNMPGGAGSDAGGGYGPGGNDFSGGGAGGGPGGDPGFAHGGTVPGAPGTSTDVKLSPGELVIPPGGTVSLRHVDHDPFAPIPGARKAKDGKYYIKHPEYGWLRAK